MNNLAWIFVAIFMPFILFGEPDDSIHAENERLTKLYVIQTYADAILTVYAVKHYDVIEWNPIAKPYVDSYISLILLRTGTLIVGFIAMDYLKKDSPKFYRTGITIINLIYTAVLIHNIMELER